jgi:hypothetical protein
MQCYVLKAVRYPLAYNCSLWAQHICCLMQHTKILGISFSKIASKQSNSARRWCEGLEAAGCKLQVYHGLSSPSTGLIVVKPPFLHMRLYSGAPPSNEMRQSLTGLEVNKQFVALTFQPVPALKPTRSCTINGLTRSLPHAAVFRAHLRWAVCKMQGAWCWRYQCDRKEKCDLVWFMPKVNATLQRQVACCGRLC